MKNIDPPTWPGGPVICQKTRRPAFDDETACKKFFDGIPAISLKRVGQCSHCEGFHALTYHRDAGDLDAWPADVRARNLARGAKDAEDYRRLQSEQPVTNQHEFKAKRRTKKK